MLNYFVTVNGRVYKKDDQVYKIELLDNLDNKIILNEEYN